jgi:hypothetical protein
MALLRGSPLAAVPPRRRFARPSTVHHVSGGVSEGLGLLAVAPSGLAAGPRALPHWFQGAPASLSGTPFPFDAGAAGRDRFTAAPAPPPPDTQLWGGCCEIAGPPRHWCRPVIGCKHHTTATLAIAARQAGLPGVMAAPEPGGAARAAPNTGQQASVIAACMGRISSPLADGGLAVAYAAPRAAAGACCHGPAHR